jgi:hypothetical protein
MDGLTLATGIIHCVDDCSSVRNLEVFKLSGSKVCSFSFVEFVSQHALDEVLDVGGKLFDCMGHVEFEVDAKNTIRKIPDEIFEQHLGFEVVFFDCVLRLEVPDEGSAHAVQQGFNIQITESCFLTVCLKLFGCPHFVRLFTLHSCHEVTEEIVFDEKRVRSHTPGCFEFLHGLLRLRIEFGC